MRIFFASLILALIISSCEKDYVNQDITQPVVFEYEYVNHAWIYTHLGWMIDEEGSIRGFYYPGEWNLPDDSGFFTKEDLKENLAQTDTTYGRVDNAEMLLHFNNRSDFRGAKMDTSDTFMADAGVGTLYAYVWDKSIQKYERILLASKGDISVTNTENKAKAAVRWLKDVGKETDRFYWFDN